MLDSGADRDVISEAVIEELNIATIEMEMRVNTVDHSVTNRRSLASFVVESVDGSYRADVDGALVGKLLTGESDVPPHRRDLSSFPHLQGVSFDRYDADVSMIICAAHADAWIAGEVRRGPTSAPFAFKSDFGWTLAGRSGRGGSDAISVNAISTSDSTLPGCLQTSSLTFASVTVPNSSNDTTGSRSRWNRFQCRTGGSAGARSSGPSGRNRASGADFRPSFKVNATNSRGDLSLLHARRESTETHGDPAVEDVVIVDETLQRHDWKLGRVIAVAGTEPLVRRVDVSRSDGKIVMKNRMKTVLRERDLEEIPKNG